MDQAVCDVPSRSVLNGEAAEAAAQRVIEVEAAVRAVLSCCGRRSIAELHCDCFESAGDHMTVTLSGHLPSFYLNQVAQELVRRVPGVHQVSNRVQVEFQRA